MLKNKLKIDILSANSDLTKPWKIVECVYPNPGEFKGRINQNNSDPNLSRVLGHSRVRWNKLKNKQTTGLPCCQVRMSILARREDSPKGFIN